MVVPVTVPRHCSARWITQVVAVASAMGLPGCCAHMSANAAPSFEDQGLKRVLVPATGSPGITEGGS